MPLFPRKAKVELEGFCREFFDSQVVAPPVIAGLDAGDTYFGTALDSVKQVDPSFAAVSLPVFRREMNALYAELFGLAFDRTVKKDSLCLRVSGWTKRYLEERAVAEVWVDGLEYNQAIAESGHRIVRGERARRANTTLLNQLRFDSFKKWHQAAATNGAEADADYIARVANRLGTDVAWSKGTTLFMLVETLVRRLGVEANDEAQFRLRAIVFGLYEGARKHISSVSFVP